MRAVGSSPTRPLSRRRGRAASARLPTARSPGGYLAGMTPAGWGTRNPPAHGRGLRRPLPTVLGMSVIELSGVSRRYDEGPPALDGLTLTVEAGEAVAVLGP